MPPSECEHCGEPTRALHRCRVCEEEVCSGCGSVDSRVRGFICTECAEFRADLLDNLLGDGDEEAA